MTRYKREKLCPQGTADAALFSLGEAVSLNNLSSHKWLSHLSPECRRHIINVFMYTHVRGITIWLYRYRIKPHTLTCTLKTLWLRIICLLHVSCCCWLFIIFTPPLVLSLFFYSVLPNSPPWCSPPPYNSDGPHSSGSAWTGVSGTSIRGQFVWWGFSLHIMWHMGLFHHVF